jgi:hypothetical protein
MLTMSVPPERRPTFDELYREIEQGITGQILVAGKLTTMSRPGSPHEHTLAHCERALDRFDHRGLRIDRQARDADVVRLPPFDAELSLAPWWKVRPSVAVATTTAP